MPFTGPYPTKFTGHTNEMLISATAFSGGVTNAGTIGPGGVLITSSTFLSGGFVNTNLISGAPTGIAVRSNSTITGAIVDSGTIRATGNGILVSGGVVSGGIQIASHGVISARSGSGVRVIGAATLGGITNSGAIWAAASGIFLRNVGTLLGNISNGGTIRSLDNVGIDLTSVAVFGGNSAAGGVTNTGTISAAGAGIDLIRATTVFGSIVNKGKIIAGHGGIDVTDGTVFGAGNVAGGITNAGTISATRTGISVNALTFLGGIVNSTGGKIVSATRNGIVVSGGTVFGQSSSASSIVNAGTISAARVGIDVHSISSFLGGITNSASGVIAALSTAILVHVSTFAGNISNAGKISAASSARGIFVSGVTTFDGSIANTGKISADFSAIKALDVTVFSGGIENDGTLTTPFNGVLLEGIRTFIGGINNKGTISAGSGGIAVGGSHIDGTIPVATFTGSIVNVGTIVAMTGFSILDSTIQGALVDSGTIRASSDGIHVSSGGEVLGGIQVASHAAISGHTGIRVIGGAELGGITNSGVVSAVRSAIAVAGLTTLSGGITNGGVIAAGKTGVNISRVTTVSGGIVNRGTITTSLATGDMGIAVTEVNVFGNSSAGGSITNVGVISAADQAIFLQQVTTFVGAIVNSGRLVAETGIHYDGFKFFGGSAFGDGITNAATITASDRGINLDLGTTFTGGVFNSGVIAAHGTGINISDVKTLSAGITNSGKITAISGAGIQVSTSSGAMLGNASASGSVVNSGTISGANGIVVQAATIAGAIINAKVIVAKGDVFGNSDGVVVRGVSTFLGGLSNTGSISAGHIGIEFGKSTTNAFGVASVVGSIFNSGTIAAKTGIALYASTITSGIVDSGSIKATSLGILINGASEILSSKTAIDIAGATFTGGISNSGVISGSAGIEIKSAHAVSIFDGGAILAAPGGTAIEFTGSGNTLTLGAGYTISGTVDPQSGNNTFQLGGSGSATFDLSSIGTQYKGFTIFNVIGGTWTVSSASTAHWTVKAGALEIASGGAVTSTTVSSGGVLAVESGGTASSSFVKAGGTEIIESGAVISGAIISSGATVELVGGIALPPSVTILAGGVLALASGVYTGLTVSSGHTLELLSGGIDSGAIVSGGGTLIVGAGGTDSGATILKGGSEIVSAGGTAIDAKVSSGGALVVSSGGVADPTTIFSGGTETIRSGGTDDGAVVSNGGKLFIQSGGSAIDITIFSGGSAVNSKGGEIDVVAGSATDSGTLVNSGTVNVGDSGTLVVAAATLNNAGTINLSGSSGPAILLLSHSVVLSGGGTVSMANFDTVADNGSGFTLTNVNNKIVGVGVLGAEDMLIVVNQAGGVIDGNGSGIADLQIGATITNAGLIEGTTSEGVAMGGGALITNSGTIAALGAGAFAEIDNVTVVDAAAKALILASGSGAQVELRTVTISGGTLKTSGGGQITTVNDNTLSGVTIAASSFLLDIPGFDDGILTLIGGTIGAGAVIETSGGTAIVSGTVTNGGTLFASATGDLVEIASGAVVNGGVALIGNGIVDIAGSSGESVKFLSDGSGGLQIADTSGHTSAYSGKVSGFGGFSHSNTVQFIELVSVTSTLNTISLSYVSAASHTSGTLFVSSGGAVVAAINMAGAYTSANFSARADSNGKVEIVDPPVLNGGSIVQGPAAPFPQHGIDLPDIAFGAQTTLAYATNAAGTGGTLTVSDGRHAAAIALLGNYMAGSFVAVADGHGGTLVTEANQQQQPVLTRPAHG